MLPAPPPAPGSAILSRESLDALLSRHGRNPHALVQVLREAQELQGWLPREMLAWIARELGLTLAHVEGVAGFYRFLHARPVGEYRVLFSNNFTDRMLGAQELMDDLCRRLGVALREVRADGRVSVAHCSCTGMGDQGPALLVNYRHVVTRVDADRIVQLAELIEDRVPVADWPAQWFHVKDNIRRADLILGTPVAPGAAISAALARGAERILAEVKKSNLRGRGGAGFGTGLKWDLCRKAPGDEHYVVCNADEGEPGTFKDRVLLARHADLVFEGMTVAAFAIGARKGFVYLRGEYRYMLEHLRSVLQRRR